MKCLLATGRVLSLGELLERGANRQIVGIPAARVCRTICGCGNLLNYLRICKFLHWRKANCHYSCQTLRICDRLPVAVLFSFL